MGGGYAGVLNRQNSYTVVPNISLGFDTNSTRRPAMFNPTNFPGATAAPADRSARPLCAAHRPRDVDRRHRAPRLRHRQVRLQRRPRAQVAAEQLRGVRPGPVAHDADADVNAGLRWDLHLPFTPADNTWSLATIEDICGISGVGNGPGGRALQHVQSERAVGRS